jgi:hypothetical protein
MPTWSTKLPPIGKHQGFDLRRTPQSSRLIAIATCESICVCDTHYWHGRTTPCERIVNDDGKTIDDSTCKACQEKQAWRTHCYISAFDGKTREHFLFECTANAAKAFQEYQDANGTLRGCMFCASRPKGGPNSKVVIETNTANLQRVTLPNEPDLPLALSVIWRLPKTALPVETPHFEPPTIRANGNRLTQMRQQTDDAANPPTLGEILAPNGHDRRPVKAK